jgi:hypothetical protein
LKTLAGQLTREKFTGFRLEPIHVTANRMDIKVVMDPPGKENE